LIRGLLSSSTTCPPTKVHAQHKPWRSAAAGSCSFLLTAPDLNPIEMAFSKLKAHLRRIGARTFDTLLQALGDICDLFDPQECWNFLKAAGYASD